MKLGLAETPASLWRQLIFCNGPLESDQYVKLLPKQPRVTVSPPCECVCVRIYLGDMSGVSGLLVVMEFSECK